MSPQLRWSHTLTQLWGHPCPHNSATASAVYPALYTRRCGAKLINCLSPNSRICQPLYQRNKRSKLRLLFSPFMLRNTPATYCYNKGLTGVAASNHETHKFLWCRVGNQCKNTNMNKKIKTCFLIVLLIQLSYTLLNQNVINTT